MSQAQVEEVHQDAVLSMAARHMPKHLELSEEFVSSPAIPNLSFPNFDQLFGHLSSCLEAPREPFSLLNPLTHCLGFALSVLRIFLDHYPTLPHCGADFPSLCALV